MNLVYTLVFLSSVSITTSSNDIPNSVGASVLLRNEKKMKNKCFPRIISNKKKLATLT